MTCWQGLDMLPLLKKPMEQIGKQVKVGGAFWEGSMTAEEQKTDYFCTIVDFSLLHTFPGGLKSAGYQMQEMGPDGTGSHEHGDASGELFWMTYPNPFLMYFYSTFPELKPETEEERASKRASVVDLRSADGAEVDLTDSPPPPKPDVHPDYPHLRLSTSAPVFKSFAINSDILQEMGPKSGQYCAEFECIIHSADGVCGTRRRIFHKRDKGVSTSNLIEHIRSRALTCPDHAEALKAIDAASRNFVDIGGESIAVFNFSEAFPHHINLMWLRGAGLTQYMSIGTEFRDHARGYEPRASFADKDTIHQLVEATDTVQKNRRILKIRRLKAQYKGRPCVGLQIDMWWDSDTMTAYAALLMTNVEEPKGNSPNAQLYLESETLAFERFPYGTKTGANIKAWILSTLTVYDLPTGMVVGITPDGAADGQCGLRMTPGLSEKVDTCQEHILQRAVLASIGLAYSKSKNEAAKVQLRLNNNIVTLSRQSGTFLKSIEETQTSAGVPAHKVMHLVPTATTRWGNQYSQLDRNNMLRTSIDTGLFSYKKANKGNTEAIVVSNESDQGSKVGKAVAAADIGMNPEQWDANLELEAFLSYPYDIKETIEHKPYCTGAQGMMLFHDLKENFCDEWANLKVKEFPKSLAVSDRERVTEQKDCEDVSQLIYDARKILREELTSRAFELRPSNWRLVQCYMSKQGLPASSYLSDAQLTLAKTLYVSALRDAVIITAMPTRSSPPRAAKKPKANMLFRGESVKPEPVQEGTPEVGTRPPTPQSDDSYDPVVDEMKRWERLPMSEILPFYDDQGRASQPPSLQPRHRHCSRRCPRRCPHFHSGRHICCHPHVCCVNPCRSAQRVQDDVGDAREIPAAFCFIQAVGLSHPARGKRRAAVLSLRQPH